MSSARRFAAALRGVRTLSQACFSGPAASACTRMTLGGSASQATGAILRSASLQSSSSAVMLMSQRQSVLGSLSCPMPFALSPLSSTSSCAGLSSSTAATAAAGSGGSVPPGELSSDEESTPHPNRRSPGSVEWQHRAQMAMADPMSRLMASRGMPLGISMEQLSQPPPPQAKTISAQQPYDMEALGDIFQTTKGQQSSHDAATTEADSWGTTKEGPAEIARRLVESNRELDAMEVAEEQVDGEDEELVLAPGEAKYRTLEQMSKDIKGLDEVFDVLASVPWLDESNVQQKELKGVAMVGLLGTLEEVGFNIRSQVLRIWAGERDHSIITECTEAKDQAALISILFHTKRLEEEFGTPAPLNV